MNLSTLPSNYYPTPRTLIEKMHCKIKDFCNIYFDTSETERRTGVEISNVRYCRDSINRR